MRTETASKESGKMTKLMATEFILMQMVPSTMGTGLRTSSMGKEMKTGKMELLIREIIIVERSTGKVK